MSNNQVLNTAYSLGQGPLSPIFPPPVVSVRAPGANDIGYPIGQIWVVKAAGAAYVLVNVAAGVATWLSIAGGGAGVFSSLTVNPGPTNLSTVGNGAVTIGNATNTGAVTISVGTGNFAINGNAHTIAIGSDAAANTITIGNNTGATSVSIQAGTAGITLTAPFVALPGPVYLYTGAGAPAGALALHVGDLYINTTAASAVTRMYIATGVGAWTNITCAG